MSFKFNFFNDADPDSDKDDPDLSEKENTEIDTNSSKSLTNPQQHKYIPKNMNLLFMQWIELTIVKPSLFYLNNVDKGKMESITQISDLVPNVYEGGFEVWECTFDLLKYLAFIEENLLCKGKTVLDLGCGSGLLGIYSAQHGAKSVHLQDYNPEVIENFTMKNYHKNCENVTDSSVKFFSGDWDNMMDYFDQYDVILSAETIYNLDATKKVLRILKNHLKPGGVAFIATKRHYFGALLGCGVIDFQNLIGKTKNLRSEVVWSSDSGLTRDILKVTFKD